MALSLLIFHIIHFGNCWPLPSNHYISSNFGLRTSPTAGASSFHKGIDIPAPENTYFLAIMNLKVTYTGFSGSGGYTIMCKNSDLTILYCHVSPNFLVNIGDELVAGQILGQVGPKNVYDVIRKSFSRFEW